MNQHNFKYSGLNQSGCVTVLMSTYNGEKYIEEQINSIINQSYKDWKLLIRDDGSSDNTVNIIRRFSKIDNRISIVSDGFGNLKPSKSFMQLCSHVQTPYFMFSDQDDVWLEDKIEKTIREICNNDSPVLVFSDLKVVDENLNVISDSFMKYSRFDPLEGVTPKLSLMQNIVVGCTVGGNKKLLEVAGLNNSNTISNALMHDWWLALVAIYMGEIKYIEMPTILYRQHGNNSLGAKSSGFMNYIRLLANGKPWVRAQKYLKAVILQAKSFERQYSNSLSDSDLRIINSVSHLEDNALPRLIYNYFKGIKMHRLDRNVSLWLSVSLGKRRMS